MHTFKPEWGSVQTRAIWPQLRLHDHRIPKFHFIFVPDRLPPACYWRVLAGICDSSRNISCRLFLQSFWDVITRSCLGADHHVFKVLPVHIQNIWLILFTYSKIFLEKMHLISLRVTFISKTEYLRFELVGSSWPLFKKTSCIFSRISPVQT